MPCFHEQLEPHINTAYLQICSLLVCSIESLYMHVQSVEAEGMQPGMPHSRS